MPLLNYTTKVRADRSIAEIQKQLATHGAKSVSIEYDNGRVAAVRFVIEVAGAPVSFLLPSRADRVEKVLWQQKIPRQFKTREHAESVAWRILKDWIEAQMALVESKQVELAEVFLAYAQGRDGKTMFQVFEANASRLLGTSEPREDQQ